MTNAAAGIRVAVAAATATRMKREAMLRSDRLVLDLLSIEHADVMVNVLAPRELYRFTGGEAPSAGDLRARYTRQVRGQSEDGAAG